VRPLLPHPRLHPPIKKAAVLTLLAALAILAFTSCRSKVSPADLTFVNGAEPQTLDPARISGQLEGRLANSLFEGLTARNAQGQVRPGLAESWVISADAKVYTFKLRENARWSNGDPLTAEDFYYSWKRVLEPETAAVYAEILFFIENAEAYQSGQLKDFNQVGLRVIDERTLEVRLTAPTPFFPEVVAFVTYLPVHRPSIEKYGDAWIRPENMVGNGAYRLLGWHINDRVQLEKNPLYWEQEKVKLNRVDALATSQGMTAVNLYLTGEADILLDKGLIPPQILADLKKRPDFHAFTFLGTYFYRFNTTRPPLNNPLVRKALAAAIDRRVIVEKCTRGAEPIASTLVPPGIAGYSQPQGLSYAPEQARAWLAQAGYPNGQGFPRLSILFNASQAHSSIAVEIQAMWKRELGIEIELRQQEWATYLKALDNLDYDIARSSWVGDYLDPNTFLDCFVSGRGNNRTGWSHPAYDSLMTKANREKNSLARMSLMNQAEQILTEQESPIAPLYFYVGMLCFDSDKIGGLEGNLLDEHPIRDWYLK
jgi:oligopeptide transport system substrate-binding protein